MSAVVLCIGMACAQVSAAELDLAHALFRAAGISVEFRALAIAVPAHPGDPVVFTAAPSLTRDGFEG